MSSRRHRRGGAAVFSLPLPCPASFQATRRRGGVASARCGWYAGYVPFIHPDQAPASGQQIGGIPGGECEGFERKPLPCRANGEGGFSEGSPAACLPLVEIINRITSYGASRSAPISLYGISTTFRRHNNATKSRLKRPVTAAEKTALPQFRWTRDERAMQRPGRERVADQTGLGRTSTA